MKKNINKILTVLLCCIILVCTKGNVALAANEQDMKSKDISNSKDVQEFYVM